MHDECQVMIARINTRRLKTALQMRIQLLSFLYILIKFLQFIIVDLNHLKN